MRITYNRQEVITAYVGSAATEQFNDNVVRKGTKSRGTTRGVNYHVSRKEAAELLFGNLRKVKGYHSSYALTLDGKKFAEKLMSAGVTAPTIKNWLVKYEDFDKQDTLYLSFHVNQLGEPK